MNKPSTNKYQQLCTVNHVELTPAERQKAKRDIGTVIDLLEAQAKKIDARKVPAPRPIPAAVIAAIPNTASVPDAILRTGPKLPVLIS